jgi:hypothetical protein
LIFATSNESGRTGNRVIGLHAKKGQRDLALKMHFRSQIVSIHEPSEHLKAATQYLVSREMGMLVGILGSKVDGKMVKTSYK